LDLDGAVAAGGGDEALMLQPVVFSIQRDSVRANTRRDSGTQESPLTDRC
jgi:hypothetical protein